MPGFWGGTAPVDMQESGLTGCAGVLQVKRRALWRGQEFEAEAVTFA